MKTLMIAFIALHSVLAFAGVTRELNGVTYFLSYDFGTADGECVLEGFHEASSFSTSSSESILVAKLNTDGTVKEVISEGTSSEVIDGIECE